MHGTLAKSYKTNQKIKARLIVAFQKMYGRKVPKEIANLVSEVPRYFFLQRVPVVGRCKE